MSTSQTPKSILIIGATSGCGLQFLRHLAGHKSKPAVHVFCRNPSKLAESDKALCASIVTGDARKSQDIEQAMTKTRAELVVLATGSGNNLGKTDIRQATGEALVTVLKKQEYSSVKVVLLSSNGAGDSKIIVGFGMGKFVSYILRNVLADHTKQEAAFSTLSDRTLMVRPVSLTDNKAGKTVVEFGNEEKAPTMHIDRGDVAAYVTQKVLDEKFCARCVNICSAK